MNTKNILKLFGIFILTIIIVVGGAYAYVRVKYDKMVVPNTREDHRITEETNNNKPPSDEEKSDDSKQEDNSTDDVVSSLNVLVLGTDKSGYRTDSVILIHYDIMSKSTCLFSIPRDYMLTLSEDTQNLINYHAKFVKFADFSSYVKQAKKESTPSIITQTVEEILDIKIDHFVVVNIAAFRQAVDAVGGVEVYIPDTLRYNDPYQNLYINLPAGVQTLNGEKAEQLVRFRSGVNGYGDIGRMQMQQYFLTNYIKKLFSFNSITKINEIVESLTDLLQTDASLNEAMEILNTIKDADFTKVDSLQLPGSNKMINGVFYLAPPEPEELKRFYTESILNNSTASKDDSKDYKIEVYATLRSKLDAANSLVEKLKSDGYNKVEAKGVYKGELVLKTRIYVPKAGAGYDLKKYLLMSEIIEEPELNANSQEPTIKVVIGKLQNPNLE